jgi:hypothetical protein
VIAKLTCSRSSHCHTHRRSRESAEDVRCRPTPRCRGSRREGTPGSYVRSRIDRRRRTRRCTPTVARLVRSDDPGRQRLTSTSARHIEGAIVSGTLSDSRHRDSSRCQRSPNSARPGRVAEYKHNRIQWTLDLLRRATAHVVPGIRHLSTRIGRIGWHVDCPGTRAGSLTMGSYRPQ